MGLRPGPLGVPCLTQDELPFLRETSPVFGGSLVPATQGRQWDRAPRDCLLLSVDKVWVGVLAKICLGDVFSFLGALGPPSPPHVLPQRGHLA